MTEAIIGLLIYLLVGVYTFTWFVLKKGHPPENTWWSTLRDTMLFWPLAVYIHFRLPDDEP